MRRSILMALGAAAIVAGGVGLLLSEDDLRDMEYQAPDTYANHEPLYNPRTIGQTFRATEHNLSAIGLHLAPYTREQPTGRIILHLRSSPDATEDIRRAVIPALAARRDIEERFLFEPIPDSRGTAYYLLLEYPDGPPERAVAVRFEDADNPNGRDYGEGERYIDGKPAGGDLGLALYHRERPIVAVQAFAGLVLFGAMLLGAALPLAGARGSARTRATAIAVLGIPLLAILGLLRNIHYLGLENWNPLMDIPLWSSYGAFILAFGPTVGVKLAGAAHVVLGFSGMFLFLRALGRTRLAALVGAAIFMFSTSVALHIAYGRVDMTALAGPPWVLFFLDQRQRSSASIGIAGLVFGILALEGGVLVALAAAMVVLAVSVATASRSAQPHALRRATLAIVLGLLLGSVRLLPELTASASLHTSVPTLPPSATRALVDIFLDSRQLGFVDKFPGQSLLWYEYGAYVGVFPLLLALVAVFRHPRRMLPFVALGALFLGAAFVSPRAEALSMFGPATRLIPFAVFSLAILASAGFDALRSLLAPVRIHRARWGERVRQAAFAFLAIIVIGDLLFVSAPVYLTAFVILPPDHAPAPHFAAQGGVVGIILTLAGLAAALALWTQRRRSGILRSL